MRTLTTELLRTTIRGERAVAEVPVIPDDAPPALREGLRRRRVAAGLGRCPCGATRHITPAIWAALCQSDPDRPTGHAPFNHTADCPAHAERLGPEIEHWQGK
ncbi:hypothetical protein ACQEVZ_38650 [Dactylosporangium sp. CA-152071]|uniref:hypothetical protein n=1 Tax=Dactylosporangium sp. CA-152071 TaxID=3239933 RepID=UPI003D8D5425